MDTTDTPQGLEHPSPAPRVFLSYAREDLEAAEKLVAALEQRGLRVLWDANVEPGTQWNRGIAQMLRHADAVLVLWSLTSVQSQWVQAEAAFGMERNALVPVLLDGTPPPLLLHLSQAIVVPHATGVLDPIFLGVLEGAIRKRRVEAGNESTQEEDEERYWYMYRLARRGAIACVDRPAAALEDFPPFPIHSGVAAVSIGRPPQANIRLSEPDVSRLHCRIVVDSPRSFRLEDLGSSGGTQLDGYLVAEAKPLRSGQHFKVGSAFLRFTQLNHRTP